jgi:hypothetical protein
VSHSKLHVTLGSEVRPTIKGNKNCDVSLIEVASTSDLNVSSIFFPLRLGNNWQLFSLMTSSYFCFSFAVHQLLQLFGWMTTVLL